MALPEAIRKRIAAAQQHVGGGRSQWLTLEPGKPVDIHVIMGEYGQDKLWYVKQGIHYLGDGKNQVRVTCPQVTADRDCPICKMRKDLKAEITAKKLDLDSARKTMSSDAIKAAENEIAQMAEMEESFYVSIRFVLNVVIKGEQTVRLFNCPKTVFEEIFGTWAKNADAVDMFDPQKSFYFTVLREGKGQNDTRYTVTPNMIPVPLVANADGSPNVSAINKLTEGRYDLDKEITVPSEAEVQEAFDKFLNGEAPASGGSSQQSSTPAKTEEKPAAPAAPAPSPAPSTAATPDTTSPAARLRARLGGQKT